MFVFSKFYWIGVELVTFATWSPIINRDVVCTDPTKRHGLMVAIAATTEFGTSRFEVAYTVVPTRVSEPVPTAIMDGTL